jgi:transposase
LLSCQVAAVQRLWRGLLGVDRRTVIEDIELGEEEGAGLAVARVRPRSGVGRRCGRCQTRAPLYDRGEGRRRWRGLDWGTVQVVLEAQAPRVNCPEHGPTVVAVPWARHHAGHTYAFDDTVAWLAVACSKTAVCELMRIAWRTVGAIVARVWADTEKRIDRFANLRRIGIDEISYKRHRKYLTVVVDHDSGRLVWGAPGRDTATLRRVFRRPGCGAGGADQPCLRRRRGLDRPRRGRALPDRDPLRRSVSCGRLGHRGARCRAAPGLE